MRTVEHQRPLRLLTVGALLLLGALQSEVTPLRYPRDNKDFNLWLKSAGLQIDPASVSVLVPGNRHLVLEAHATGSDGQSQRVVCTSGTEFPASGGSFFRITCEPQEK